MAGVPLGQVYHAVEERSQTPLLLEKVLSSDCGTHKKDEVDLRLFYRWDAAPLRRRRRAAMLGFVYGIGSAGGIHLGIK